MFLFADFVYKESSVVKHYDEKVRVYYNQGVTSCSNSHNKKAFSHEVTIIKLNWNFIWATGLFFLLELFWQSRKTFVVFLNVSAFTIQGNVLTMNRSISLQWSPQAGLADQQFLPQNNKAKVKNDFVVVFLSFASRLMSLKFLAW